MDAFEAAVISCVVSAPLAIVLEILWRDPRIFGELGKGAEQFARSALPSLPARSSMPNLAGAYGAVAAMLFLGLNLMPLPQSDPTASSQPKGSSRRSWSGRATASRPGQPRAAEGSAVRVSKRSG
jgi:hypothetical protein